MSRTRTFESSLLQTAEQILSSFSSDYEERLQLIEMCSSLYGGFSIDDYWKTFGISINDKEKTLRFAKSLKDVLDCITIPPSMALSSLAREPIPVSEQKSKGAFYTDFRLSTLIKEDCIKNLKKTSKIADLAAGSGILLAGIADAYHEMYPKNYDKWIENNVFAYDLSRYALRGARIALAVHTTSVSALKKMNSNWEIGDSLISDSLNKKRFDLVVGNPPWGKVKLSRHSFLNNNGTQHIYGSDYNELDEEIYNREKTNSLEYSKKLKEKYSLLGNAEPDMYMAFIQRAVSSLKPGGHLSFIVPAGLIRSQGTVTLREHLIDNNRNLKYYLLDNKPRFFEIDTRFKFVIISHDKKTDKEEYGKTIVLSICSSKDGTIIPGEEVSFDLSQLKLIRPDLTIPECKNNEEKDLFTKCCQNGQMWSGEWKYSIAREVDMTNDRSSFQKQELSSNIPVIEGRMVQQFRFGAKAYISGSGRSAKWIPCSNTVKPQFYISQEALSSQMIERIQNYRVGYCDIAGQTNERAMMSCLIPKNVICGNKVPTLLFEGDENRLYYWIGVTNSFVFDWLLRRVISTTVNYFLLYGLPFPKVDMKSDLVKTIITNSKKLSEMKNEYYTDPLMAKLRAQIDVCVARAYGISFHELEIIMEDFPLLDRGQPAIRSESKSYITRDTILAQAEDNETGYYNTRLNEEILLGAKAYIPSEMVSLCRSESL